VGPDIAASKPEQEPLRLAEGSGLILSAGDPNYTRTVEAIAAEASAARPVTVWSVSGDLSLDLTDRFPSISVSHITASFSERVAVSPKLRRKVISALAKVSNDPLTRELLARQFLSWVENRLPMLLGLWNAFSEEFRRARPAYLLASTGRHPVCRLAITAAKNEGIPTVDVQVVLLSDYKRLKSPIADWASVMETMSKHLFTDHFKFPEDRILVAGSARIDAMRKDQVSTRRTFGKSVLYLNQPLDTRLTNGTVEHLIKAVRATPGATLTIKLHPRDGVQTLKRFAALIARQRASDVCSIAPPETTLPEAVETADLVATYFSNAGLEAAVLGRDVLAIAMHGHFPLNLSREGLALGASNPEEIGHQTTQYLTDEHFRERTTAARMKFLGENEQLLKPSAAKRIVSFLEKITVSVLAIVQGIMAEGVFLLL
jgi:hypothetical protein